jgi:uncharacterized protein
MPRKTDPTTKSRRWMRRGVWVLALLAILVGIAFAGITFVQARAMTHYAPVDIRTTRLHEAKGIRVWRLLLSGPAVRRQANTRNPEDFGMRFSTAHIKGAHGLELEIWRIQGRPGVPRVVMFPGYGASKDTMLHAAQELNEYGCEMWMVDFHGIGGSEGAINSVGYHEASDVTAAVQHADHEFKRDRPLVVYGVSMGAAASLRAAALGDVQPDGMILEAPFDRLARTIGNRFALLGLPSGPFGSAVAFWAGVQQGFNGLGHNPVEYARYVRCPTLLLQGAQDDSVGYDAVREVAHSLGDRGTFRLIPEAGHSYLVLNARETWRHSVHDFLARISRRDLENSRAQVYHEPDLTKNTLASILN